jgi:serine/threonine-protein kinase ATR
MFRAMAKGVRDGDPKMKIVTAAMAAGKPDEYSKAVSTVKDLENLYDVFNIHTYSMIEGWPTWRRVYPEHPDVPYLKVIDEMIAYRNASVPGKEIWITEFGYDANSGETKPKGNWEKWVSSTETEQAQWLARSFLIFSGMDVEKAFLYYYDDQDEPSFHASSGITRKGVPKQAYYSLVHMQNTLGEYRFSKILVHDKDEVYAYEYVNPLKPKEPIVVAWRPTDDKKEMSKSFPITGTVTKAERMPLKEGPADPVSTNVNGGMVDLTLSETPTYLFLKLP